MKRRTFIRNTSLGAAALNLPFWVTRPQEVEYSIDELMGKAPVELFGENINLRKAAHDAFVEMKKAAYQDGITISVVSSFRDYERQRQIFESKFIRFTDDDGMDPLSAIDKIVEYSTIPGTSRHHWGTDVDLIDASKPTSGDVLVPEKFGPGGPFEDFKNWMDEHSESFGFYLVYTDNNRRRGFKYEPWHYSYAPLSIPMLEQYRRINLVKIMSEEDFIGSEYFTTGFLRTYYTNNILDINPDLL